MFSLNRQPGVDVEVGYRLGARTLRAEPVGFRLERSGVGARPPVAKRSGGGVGTALIVEAAGHLVADDADRTVVDRRIGHRV